METTEQMRKGEIPVTEEQLRFLAKNHKTYNLTRLDVSQIKNFSYLFSEEHDFNQPIGDWDVSNGVDFSYMFYSATSFNQPIGNWDVSNGLNFSYMFFCASSFNKPISNWNMLKGDVFLYMFFCADSFNQPVCNWLIKKGSLNVIMMSNFNISVKNNIEKIGFTENVDQLQLIFKDSPNSPFPKDFNYNSKELCLIKSNVFYGFIDENNNAYQINVNKITTEDLIDICDIKKIKEVV